MALFQRFAPAPDIEILIWQIAETEVQLAENVVLQEGEKIKLSNLSHPEKRQEFLALRQCLYVFFKNENHPYSGGRPPVFYTENGKPFLKNGWKISFSHTHGFAGVALSRNFEVGLDLEMHRVGIKRIAPKFLREGEKATLRKETEIAHITHYWGIKEAMVKITGDRRLNFKKQLLVEPFFYDEKKEARGKILLEKETLEISAVFGNFGNLHWTVGWALPQPTV